MFSRRACPTSIIACLAGASQVSPRSSRRGRSDDHAGYLIAGSAFGRYVASPHTRGPILPGTRNFWDSYMSSPCVRTGITLATVCSQWYVHGLVLQSPKATLKRTNVYCHRINEGLQRLCRHARENKGNDKLGLSPKHVPPHYITRLFRHPLFSSTPTPPTSQTVPSAADTPPKV